jgi:GcrA cell cycle regulator
MVLEGKSASEIGRAMGGISRNAVLGTMWRYGIQATVKPGWQNKPKANGHTHPISAVRKPPVAPPPPKPPRIEGITIATIRPGQCQWIDDENPTGNSPMCGQPTTPKHPTWCPYHASKAYVAKAA